MYSLVQKLLFCLPAEFSHHLGLRGLRVLHRLGLSGLLAPAPVSLPVTCMGISFPNPVGLAAGLDKNGDFIDALGSLGFGFIEVGTVTPRPQPGNPRPRLFRLTAQQAIINRMGFNNKGVEHMVRSLQRSRYRGVIGVNIGKNFSTPVERATEDYLFCLRAVYEYADYVVVNLSSPNTPGLRSLQFGSQLESLLAALTAERELLELNTGRRVPLVLKLAPDLAEAEIEDIARVLKQHPLAGVIATNTTLDRKGVEASPYRDQAGGLSGRPLLDKSTAVLRSLGMQLDQDVALIGTGGISAGGDALQKAEAGAVLVQLYSGFIFQGPALIHDCLSALQKSSG